MGIVIWALGCRSHLGGLSWEIGGEGSRSQIAVGFEFGQAAFPTIRFKGDINVW